jgi:hypothetical protein
LNAGKARAGKREIFCVYLPSSQGKTAETPTVSTSTIHTSCLERQLLRDGTVAPSSGFVGAVCLCMAQAIS